MQPQKIGLILTGGGSRAAYQVGVLKAIAEFLPRASHSPFAIICGTSAGALNAATLAINARHFRKGVKSLLSVWKNFHVSEVYRSDFVGVFQNSLRWVTGLLLSSFGIERLNHISLLDNTPLVELLEQALPCEKIQESIDNGTLHALSITASGYGSGHSVTFYQGVDSIQPWRRARRIGVPTRIEIQHLLASAAIPFIFPAVHIHREHFGDGSMRQLAPISSALHLGADRVLVVGMGHGSGGVDEPQRGRIDEYPSIAHIAGHALDSIFLDSMEVDLERLQRINRTVSLIPEALRGGINLRHVDVLVISPSQPLEKIAEHHIKNLPWTIRLLLRAVGVSRRRGANLVSYLLFDKTYCRALIDLGYADAVKRKAEIIAFLDQHPAANSELAQ
ncbi:MAG: patatin-like phospholipase family protein [Gallionellaceae bacterium]|jgi:NTE family protein